MLTPPIRSTFAALGLAASVLLCAAGPVQDGDGPTAPAGASAPADAPTPKTFPPYRRVPSNFGKVGLSNQQREDIYIIRGRYQSEIAELRARIEELSRKEMTECESVLTDAQRKLLDQLRAASRPALLGSGD